MRRFILFKSCQQALPSTRPHVLRPCARQPRGCHHNCPHGDHGTVRWVPSRFCFCKNNKRTIIIEDRSSQCPLLQMTYNAENPHADVSAAPGGRPRRRPPRSLPPPRHAPRTHNNGLRGKTDVLSSTNGPSTVELQQRCQRISASVRSPSWMPMTRLRS